MTDLPTLKDAEEFFVTQLKETYLLMNSAEKLKILDAFRKSVEFLVKAHAASHQKIIAEYDRVKFKDRLSSNRYLTALAACDAVLKLTGLNFIRDISRGEEEW